MFKYIFATLFCVISFLCSAQDPERPNILFIVCDDLNQLGMGAIVDSTVHTPYLDSLVSTSITFTSAHANVAGCGPSRASMFSGLLPQTSGHSGYKMSKNSWLDNPILAPTTSVFKQFLDNGYQVYGSGKVYHGYRLREEDFTEYYSVPTQGPFAYDKRIHSDMPEEFEGHGLSFARLENIPSYPEYTGWQNRDGTPFYFESDEDRDLMADELTVEYCREKLAEYASADQDEPFFLSAGIYNPHEPFHVPGKYWDLYDTATFDFGYLQPDSSIPVLTAVTNRYNSISNEAYDVMEGVSQEDDPNHYLRQFIHGYYASVSFVDDQIGALLEALEENGLADNTVVILTSDHGFHLGSKNLVAKSTMWNDASAIPFIVRVPGEEPRFISEPISLIDLYPTLLEFGSVPEPDSHVLDGRPIQEIMYQNEKGSAILFGISRESMELGELSKVEHSHHALLQGRYKYIHYSSGEDELYDLEIDFRETNDLSELPIFQPARNLLYRELRNRVGYIRPPSAQFENLYFGDFSQDLNGWSPSEPNPNFSLSEGDSIISTEHLIIAGNQTQVITNENLIFRSDGIHEFGFWSYAECDSGSIEFHMEGAGVTYLDTAFTVSSDLTRYQTFIDVTSELPEFGDVILDIQVSAQCALHLDDVYLHGLEEREEAYSSCELAEAIQMDVPYELLVQKPLKSELDMPSSFCTSNSGSTKQLWQEFSPSGNSGFLAAYLPNFDPVIEVFDTCAPFAEPIFCSNEKAGSIEFGYFSELDPSETYFTRITTDKNLPMFSSDQDSVRSMFMHVSPIEFSGPNNELLYAQDALTFVPQPAFNYPILDVTFFIENIQTGEASQYTTTFDPLLSYNLADIPGLGHNVLYSVAASFHLTYIDFQIPAGPSKKIYIENGESSNLAFNLFPNPAVEGQSSLGISIKDNRTNAMGILRIYDLMGRMLFERSLKVSSDLKSIEGIPLLSSGTYTVQLIVGEEKIGSELLLVH